jgi:DNA-binding MarR family transcriptional regulator
MRDAPADFAARLQRLLYQLVQLYQRCETLCLAQQDVTVAQAYTLLALPPDGDVTMNELSETMGLAASTMTRTMDQLVRKGLARRGHDAADRRVVCVALSAKGQQLRRTLDRAQRAFFQTTLKQLDADERASVVHGLETAVRLLTEELESGTACDAD